MEGDTAGPAYPRPPMSRRVLFVSYFFPPLGGAGVQRATKFVKYLPGAGWEPVVVTTRSRWYPVRDETLAQDVPPGTRVVAARELTLPRRIAPPLGLLPGEPNRLLTLPDEMAGWIPWATRAALREIERRRPDVVFTTSAPYSAHLVGLLLKRRTGLPWVADFRDEWTTNPEAGEQPAWVRAATTGLERAVLAGADHVTVTTDDARLAAPLDGRRTTITNGVDPDDVDAAAGAAPPGDRFRLSFVGTMYAGRDCAPVFAALKRLAAAGRIDPSRVEFRIVGNVWLPQQPDAGAVSITQTGYVEHATALREMAEASALVVYLPSASRAIPGKLFEYLGTGRPVLSVAHPDNQPSRIVRELDAGHAVAPEDEAGMERALEDLWQRWEAGQLAAGDAGRRERALARFSRERLTADLAKVLESVTP